MTESGIDEIKTLADLLTRFPSLERCIPSPLTEEQWASMDEEGVRREYDVVAEMYTQATGFWHSTGLPELRKRPHDPTKLWVPVNILREMHIARMQELQKHFRKLTTKVVPGP